MHISTIYDRTNLIHITTTTVRHIVIMGLTLVTLVLLSMLGDWRITLIAAITIPFAVLFAFSLMVLTNQSANLISIGAIDFGILVDASDRRPRKRLPQSLPAASKAKRSST